MTHANIRLNERELNDLLDIMHLHQKGLVGHPIKLKKAILLEGKFTSAREDIIIERNEIRERQREREEDYQHLIRGRP